MSFLYAVLRDEKGIVDLGELSEEGLAEGQYQAEGLVTFLKTLRAQKEETHGSDY